MTPRERQRFEDLLQRELLGSRPFAWDPQRGPAKRPCWIPIRPRGKKRRAPDCGGEG